jgi:hypothetical protein
VTGAPVGAEVSMIGANVSRTGAEVGAEVWIGANVVLDVLAVTGALVVLNKGRVGAVPKGEDVSLKATKEGSADGSPVGWIDGVLVLVVEGDTEYKSVGDIVGTVVVGALVGSTVRLEMKTSKTSTSAKVRL